MVSKPSFSNENMHRGGLKKMEEITKRILREAMLFVRVRGVLRRLLRRLRLGLLLVLSIVLLMIPVSAWFEVCIHKTME